MTRQRYMMIGLGLLLASVVTLGVGCPKDADNTETATETVATTDEAREMMNDEEEDEVMMEDDEDTMMDNEDGDDETTTNEQIDDEGLFGPDVELEDEDKEAAPSAGVYTEYSEEALANASGRTLIFFHAGWCPTCRALEESIQENLSSIPSDLTILKADFDTERDLRKEYGVNVQHTLVQVDEDGNEITSIHGILTLDGVLAKLQ